MGVTIGPATEGPIDRALLAAFAESVHGGPPGAVADVGCGPGRVAALLVSRRTEVIGVDASSAMLAHARSAHPCLPLVQGLLDPLPLRTGSLAGVVSWYSIIHTPPERLRAICDEVHRVLAPGGHLLLAFHSGAGGHLDRRDVQGRPVALRSYRHDPGEVGRAVVGAGLEVQAHALRRAELAHESTPQAFLLPRAPEQR